MSTSAGVQKGKGEGAHFHICLLGMSAIQWEIQTISTLSLQLHVEFCIGTQLAQWAGLLTRSARVRIVQIRAVGFVVRAAVGKDEGVGSPGVGGVGEVRADVPGGVQVVRRVILADDEDLGAVGVVAADTLVAEVCSALAANAMV